MTGGGGGVCLWPGKRLLEIGANSAAAQVFLGSDRVREAIEALVQASDWQKAKKIAQEMEPRSVSLYTTAAIKLPLNPTQAVIRLLFACRLRLMMKWFSARQVLTMPCLVLADRFTIKFKTA